MGEYVSISDFGAKIDLLLRSDSNEINTNAQVSKHLRIHPDYLSRMKNGTRPLTEHNFIALCDLFDLTQSQWYEDVETFGKHLGFSRKLIASITKKPLPGIEFASRLRDKRIVAELFNVIEGYWESYYYSVSKMNKQLVSRDLFVVKQIDEDGYIECDIIDTTFNYSGWCFAIKGHLYLFLEKDELLNEVIVYAFNQPDRQPPMLFGIILCLSGGIDDTHAFPSAARVVFRYIGKDATALRQRYSIDPSQDVDAFLRSNIPAYIDPETETDPEVRQILDDISNAVEPDAIPFALRMTR